MGRLSEAFRRDHQRWEQALTDVQRRVAAGEWAPALARFAAFCDGIERHMAAEEQCLFSAFEAEAGPAGIALTETLRKGHRDLHVFFDELQDAMAAHDEEEFHRIASTMRALLRLHDEKEEAELYPAVEARLGEEGAAVIARLAGP
jgi:hemerythrin-like domain-containing protein